MQHKSDNSTHVHITSTLKTSDLSKTIDTTEVY